MNNKGSIQIYYSARVEQLVDALNQDIKVHYQHHPDPLKPVNVIVPNGHIQKYLNLRLTEINGISANLDFPFLEVGLFKSLLSLESADGKPDLLSLDQIELAVFAFLAHESNQDNTLLAPLYDYLETRKGEQLAAQKRWQLAQQLALLFIDYELSRPEMIKAWVSGQLFYSDSQNKHLIEVEAAQATVYQAIFNREIGTNGTVNLTISTLLQNIDRLKTVEPNPIYLFVPSRLSPLHRQIILVLARHYPLSIYHLNVCREFWQDMETEDEINWRKRIQQIGLTAAHADGQFISSEVKTNSGQLAAETFFDLDQSLDEFENPLLKAWGKPGRETLRLLSDLENDAIHAGILYQDQLLDEAENTPFDSAKCTLSAMQYGILNRTPNEDNGIQLTDTVLVASAPAIEVEVAQVYNSILYELAQDLTLKLSDIVVLVADMANYRYVIEQVFDGLNRHMQSPLRYSISDSSAAEESLYAQALMQLFGLIETDFIRDEVFSFLANPCVMAAMDSRPSEVDAWLQAAVDLGIFRGYDRLYQGQDETVTQLYTWRQGLKRLHRSLVQSGAENSPLGGKEIGRLSVIMTRLNDHKKELNQSLTALQWQQNLDHIFSAFIAIPDLNPEEESVSIAVSRRLQQLADKQPELVLSFYDIKQYLLSGLSEISAGRGGYLSGGVVCAALQPMRPVPFKISYVLGLGESQFPGRVRHNTLDLAAYSRRIGDVNQVENNKYLFLETVMSTRHKLFLSYVGRDASSGEILSPSVVVNDVMEWVNQYTENELSPQQLPLSAADNFKRQENPNKKSLHQNHLFIDYLLYRYQAEDMSDSDLYSDSSFTDSKQKSQWQQFHAIFNEQKSTVVNNDSLKLECDLNLTPNLNIKKLSDYLINPTESVFEQQGGIIQRIEDTELLSDEPLKVNPLDKHSIFNRAVDCDLQFKANKAADAEPNVSAVNLSPHSKQDLATVLDQEYQLYLQQSKVPIRMFAALDALKDIDKNEDYQLLKKDIEFGQLTPWSANLRIGQAYSQDTILHSVPAIPVMSTDDLGLQLSASISHLMDNQHQQIAGQVIIRAGKFNKNKNYELMAKAFLEWCLLTVHDDLDIAEDYQVWVIFQDKVMRHDFKRYLVDKKMITEYLSRLSVDYTAGVNAYLPLSLWSDLSFKFNKKDSDAPVKSYPFNSQFYFAYQDLAPHLRQQLQQNYQQAVATAGEVGQTFGDKKGIAYDENKTILDYPPTADILHDFQQRFRLFFALLEQVDIRYLS